MRLEQIKLTLRLKPQGNDFAIDDQMLRVTALTIMHEYIAIVKPSNSSLFITENLFTFLCPYTSLKDCNWRTMLEAETYDCTLCRPTNAASVGL